MRVIDERTDRMTPPRTAPALLYRAVKSIHLYVINYTRLPADCRQRVTFRSMAYSVSMVLRKVESIRATDVN